MIFHIRFSLFFLVYVCGNSQQVASRRVAMCLFYKMTLWQIMQWTNLIQIEREMKLLTKVDVDKFTGGEIVSEVSDENL